MRELKTWTDAKGRTYRQTTCWRCNGTGIYRWNTSQGPAGGTCFRCGGNGIDPKAERIDEKYLAQVAKREAKRVEKAAAAAAARDARVNEWKAANAELVARLAALPEKAHPVLLDLASKLPLSEKQVELALRLLAERDAEDARKAVAPAWEAGRQTVEGVILAVKEYPGYLGQGTSTKWVVKLDDERRVFLTAPSAISSAEKGARVRFTATIEVSNDDPLFAFGKRPAKSEVITPEASNG